MFSSVFKSSQINTDSISSHGRPQAWVRGGTCPPPLWKRPKCFCAVPLTAKRSVYELYTHYFHNLLSASRDFDPRPPLEITYCTPSGDFRPHTLNLPTPGKNPAGAQVSSENVCSIDRLMTMSDCTFCSKLHSVADPTECPWVLLLQSFVGGV